ncbi:hypothetical protein [Fusibacter ferrireducens]|uniref:DUF4367 domain-containing protein n=1 Tax=Fusibacter ferrireducens TaxID=2785058 RepID=A0ABR9ZS88_9FIRM|nr:hypothetical protein [Fusibacter ferrireducens]MBF4692494.1 hypothetical protein [Fusibacter ferrireducens]
MEDKNLDRLLKSALSSNYEPESELNTKIIQKVRANKMRNVKKNKMSVILVACCILLCFSIVSFAAWQYLTPKEIAVGLGNEMLASAFESDDAIFMNESQSYGDYTVTLLGAISGRNLTDFCANGEVVSERTYAVVGISRTDGAPMPKTSDDNYGKVPFFVSPLIQGLNPWQYNIVTMNGGYSEIVTDGIMYRIIECDNIELFADRELYLCVSNTAFYDRAAYLYDERTGIISVNGSYEGMNLLFQLPLDEGKSDKVKADEYLKSFEELNFPESYDEDQDKMNSETNRQDFTEQDGSTNGLLEGTSDISMGEIIKDWTLISEEKVELNTAGEIQYHYETVMGPGIATIAEETLFELGEVGYSKVVRVYEKNASLFYRDEKGVITVFGYERTE